MSRQFQNEIAFLDIESSPAFVRSPEGNGCAKRFIRSLKENLLWVQMFETVEELRQARLAFRQTDNTTWLIEPHGFLMPAQFRHNQLQAAAIAAQGPIRCPKNRGRYRVEHRAGSRQA
jgi:putative transposase